MNIEARKINPDSPVGIAYRDCLRGGCDLVAPRISEEDKKDLRYWEEKDFAPCETKDANIAQQLKTKMPTLEELYPWINESTDGFQSGANAIYERMCQHFGH